MPGPAVRVTEGDTVNFTLENPKTNFFPHAMDFPCGGNRFPEELPGHQSGETISFTFVAKKPGVFFYHCGAAPMIQHVARGMFGAIIVDPRIRRSGRSAPGVFVGPIRALENPTMSGHVRRKFDYTVFNGGSSSIIPFSSARKRWRRNRMSGPDLFCETRAPNEFSSLHPIGEIWITSTRREPVQ